MLASPANPTGTVCRGRSWEAFAVTEARGGWLIVDEIYHGQHGDPLMTALASSERLFVVSSFSSITA
ncbi:MAG: aminotransferase class I/II-fold pyridoxal phosphate-dependent enzyme [Candidatus Competibacteraceae bacterium]